jgi:hypothetical protein
MSEAVILFDSAINVSIHGLYLTLEVHVYVSFAWQRGMSCIIIDKIRGINYVNHQSLLWETLSSLNTV